jgi:hypothetical protein
MARPVMQHFIVLKSVAWAQTFSRVPRRNRGVIWVTPAHMNPVAVSGWILNLADGRIFTISIIHLFLFFMGVGRFYSFLLCAVL